MHPGGVVPVLGWGWLPGSAAKHAPVTAKTREYEPRRNGKRMPRWSNEEIATLSELYPIGGVKVVQRAMPARSDHAIREKAKQLGLRAPVGRPRGG